ncbi:hypothetical protein [Pseudoblastomonas halimionae]|uniref:Uncharacterized protein n=1 Tax=Alteriqipengyuania halimionae TaxID=1926630 RepID=A0A6I4U8R2_9SPHN|nr:hypothetical protein [Alteriqipengyuania halimionae]MXP10667.1 hypothetical protein [Alteriqipengyuania halimionae]
MKQIYQALLLAAAMLVVALLARIGIVPERVAQIAPFALLALFPGAWLGSRGSCNLLARIRS